jgi:phage terminase large subunit-like protein
MNAATRAWRFFVVDVVAGRWGTLEREQQIKTTAELDRAKYGHRVTTHIEEEGGSGGKSDAEATVRNLAGFAIYAHRKRTAKHIAWKSFACQVQRGNVWIVTENPDPKYIPEWAADFIRELDALAGDPKQDERKLKDCADAASGAFDYLTGTAALMDRELLCSGDKTDDTQDYRQPLTKDEIEQLPDDIASILLDIRENDGGRSFEDG